MNVARWITLGLIVLIIVPCQFYSCYMMRDTEKHLERARKATEELKLWNQKSAELQEQQRQVNAEHEAWLKEKTGK